MNNRGKELFFKHRDIWVCLFLIITTLSVYWSVTNYEFVNIDDTTFVTENRYTQAGITREGIKYTFKNFGAPLSVLSHMLDCELFGLDSGRHHLTNLILHIANVVLLYLIFNLMTGTPWNSAFVAALFALHPLNVESVAWVAERNNLLSTLFGFLTIAAYVWYIRRPDFLRYMTVFLFFVLGLFSKPMLVTLPFVLLLLDYWPLDRVRLGSNNQIAPVNGKESVITKTHPSISPFYRLILEKIPLIAVSIFSSFWIITISKNSIAEGIGGLASLERLPIKFRIANALISYVSYIGKLIYPKNLAVYYPYPKSFPAWKIVLACLLLGCITFLAIRTLRQHPWFSVGWLWYLGTLVPVIQLVQMGAYRMADRYAYVPFIGLFIIVAWGVPYLLERWRYGKILLATTAIIILSTLMTLTWNQKKYWKNSITLFEHTIEVTSDNWLAHNNLGVAFSRQNRINEAVSHLKESLRIKPHYEDAHSNLGSVLAQQGQMNKAIDHFLMALRTKPDHFRAHYNLGVTLKKIGQTDKAIAHYLEALRINPDFAATHNNLGVALADTGRIDEAIGHYLEALRIKPDNMESHINLGNALVRRGQPNEAIDHYLEALRIKPDHVEAHSNLGVALANQGRTDEAIAQFLESLRIKPDHVKVHFNLGNALEKQGRIDEAVDHYKEALRIKPDFVEAYINLGNVLSRQKRTNEAISYYLKVLRIKSDDVELYNRLGNILLSQGVIDKAIDSYLEAIRIKPDYAEAHSNLGVALTKQGRIDEAIKHYLEALWIKPDFAEAHNNMGNALRKEGRIDEAVSYFREALRIKPNYIAAKNNLEKVLMIQQQNKKK